MRIVVDTSRNVTRLMEKISDRIRKSGVGAKVILENRISIESDNKSIKALVAETVAEFILENFEKEIACCYLRTTELFKHESEEVFKAMNSDEGLRRNRLELLKKELMQYAASGMINIDGLVAFRLKEYKEELRFATELFADEMAAKKSYDEFIGLMKYFAEIGSPVTETVVLREKFGEYSLTDADGNPLELRFDEEFADELASVELTGDDILISNLMAAMPRKIIFDNVDEKKPIINTINRIFEGRITH